MRRAWMLLTVAGALLSSACGGKVFLDPPDGAGGSGSSEATFWQDLEGDVSNSSSDIIGGGIFVSKGVVDLRVQFAGKPFAPDANHAVVVCLDLDQDASTGGACGSNDAGVERTVELHSFGGPLGVSGLPGIDPCQDAWIDSSTNTVRILFPVTTIADDGAFHYTLESGSPSGGEPDRVPDEPALDLFAGHFVSQEVDELPPFSGQAACSN